MKKQTLIFSIFLSISAISCASVSPPSPAAAVTAAIPQEQTWESQWRSLLVAAQKEGTVVVYTALKPEAREAIASNFKAKFGIQVEMIVGRGGDLPPKIRAERNAGLYLADIGLIGPGTYINDLKPMGITPALESMLVLPEVRDGSKWFGGKLPFLDDEKQAIAPVLSGRPFYIRNAEKVKPEEIAVARDLLKPRWKSNIILFDPSVSGNANVWFMIMHKHILGMEEGKKFMQELVKQEPVMVRDDRIIVDSVARGKYLVGIGASPSVTGEFTKAGAPIDFIDTREPREITPGAGLLNAFSNPPHPAAQTLFVNWLLSKDGVAILARTSDFAPARLDVPTEGIPPIMFPRSGDILTTVELELLKGKMRSDAREIFGGLAR